MSSSPEQSQVSPKQSQVDVEDLIEEDIQKEKVKEIKPLPTPRSKLEVFLKKEMEFLGVAQTMIGIICCFFGVTHKFIPNFPQKEGSFSSFQIGYPIWGGLLFTISGYLLIASERKGTKYLVRSSFVMAILSSVVAGFGIMILLLNIEQTSSILHECQNQPVGDFCFAAMFLYETAAMVLFLTILEMLIGSLLPFNEILGKVTEAWFAKHPKAAKEILYEELDIYTPIAEDIELHERKSAPMDPKDISTESRELLDSTLYQSPEEFPKT
ncbi:high affinity immunoglobulin epsilon receptor subunit beta-like [Monodelphis domestica]|uniref:high affinity immunoglobulin epsilon receptor subunit beta-like n=1 Tax=Monodelphis domestica TaxID=13616 RepID=UPI0024E20720|nr:high affinity immunoglobulin epsilon receptor subunit beta-like [Monodelphis domestica]